MIPSKLKDFSACQALLGASREIGGQFDYMTIGLVAMIGTYRATASK